MTTPKYEQPSEEEFLVTGITRDAKTLLGRKL